MSRERAQGRRFDRDFGVATQAILFLEDLDPEAVGDAGAHATHYEPVPPSDFHELLSHIPEDAIAHAAFVDIGSGLGRAVFLASTYPFKQVLGIEISPGLHATSETNLAGLRNLPQRCRDVRLVRADARLYRYPPGDLVCFLYNPFDDLALAQTLDSVVRSRTRNDRIYAIYHTPVHEEVLARYGFAPTIALTTGTIFEWDASRVAQDVAIFL